MLNFDEDRFVRIQSGAVAQASGLRAVAAQALADGATNLFLLGSGGAGILMEPAARLLRARSAFPVWHENPAEVLAQGHAHLGNTSLVVVPSLSGTTAESLEMVDHCRAGGATTVALTAHGDSPLAQRADHVFVNPAADDTSSESFYLQSLSLALAVLQERKEIDTYDSVLAELERLPRLLVDAKRAFEPRARAWAEKYKDEPYHIFTGAGSTWARRGTTACASSRRCSGSGPDRCTPPTSSTARWNWSSRASAWWCSTARTTSRPLVRAGRRVRRGTHRQAHRPRHDRDRELPASPRPCAR